MIMRICKVAGGGDVYHKGGLIKPEHIPGRAVTTCGIEVRVPEDIVGVATLGDGLPDPPRAELCPRCFP